MSSYGRAEDRAKTEMIEQEKKQQASIEANIPMRACCESCGTPTEKKFAMLSFRGIGLSVCAACRNVLTTLHWQDLKKSDEKGE